MDQEVLNPEQAADMAARSLQAFEALREQDV
jgi:hypothetical protein